MATKAISLVGQNFNQTSAIKFIQERITNFDPNDPLWPELVARHPEAALKIGSGIARFFRTLNINHCFQLNILRTDGTEMDISWRTCLTGKSKTPRDKLLSALRHAVYPQTQEFKNSQLWVCALCGDMPDNRRLAQVDHYPKTFRQLVHEFLIQNPAPPTEFDDDRHMSEAAIFRAVDAQFQLTWQSYHLLHASFRILCRACNCSLPKL